MDGSLEEIRWARVTPSFFHVMGARMRLGRAFTEADGQLPPASEAAGAPGAPPTRAAPLATILSYEYWQRRFGGDTSVLGRDLPGTAPGSAQIVGVLAPGFELFFPPDANIERVPDHWFAGRLTYDSALRNAVSLRVIGRLKEGVTLTEAQAGMDGVAAELRAKSLTWETAGFRLRVERMQEHVVAHVRPTIVHDEPG